MRRDLCYMFLNPVDLLMSGVSKLGQLRTFLAGMSQKTDKILSLVESILDRDVFTLEELLDVDEIIQECKAVNNRLIGFLRGKPQVQQMLRYVIEAPPEGADNARAYRFPFIACEVITCEIDAIFKTLVDDEELMNMLFGFLDPDRPHGALLAGYFSKVVICLLVRKTLSVMRYLQNHKEILQKVVDLIGITSIMEVLLRLIGADDHIYAFHSDSLQWLADTDLLDLLVDKLSPQYPPEVHANVAETLSAIVRIGPSSLATKLASPRFATKLLHVLEEPECKSSATHSLSVCCAILDPKRSAIMAAASTGRWHHVAEPPTLATSETIEAMLQRLGDLLKLLDVSADENNVLPTTFGQLKPPLGIHRLKIVEFIAVLLRTDSEEAQKELLCQNAFEAVLNLFFNYPFNNMLHHHVEAIINSCILSNDQALVDHLFKDCNFLTRLMAIDEDPSVGEGCTEAKVSPGKRPLRVGNLGHLTRIANKIAECTSPIVQAHIQENHKWLEWSITTLATRNSIESVNHWICGRPSGIQHRPVESDEDDMVNRDYDISAMANNLSREVYCTSDMFENEDVEEEMFFDDDQEVVIASFHLRDEHGLDRKENIFGNSPGWSVSPFFLNSRGEDGQTGNSVSSPNSSGGSSSDDEVVVGEDDELLDTATSSSHDDLRFEAEEADTDNLQKRGVFEVNFDNHDVFGHHRETNSQTVEELSNDLRKVGLSDSLSLFHWDDRQSDPFASKSVDVAGTSGRDPFGENNLFENPFEASFGGSMEPVEGSPADVLEREVVLNGVANSSINDIPAIDPSPKYLENHKDEVPQGPEIGEVLFEKPVTPEGMVADDGTVEAGVEAEVKEAVEAVEKVSKEEGGIVETDDPNLLSQEEAVIDKDSEPRTKDEVGDADYNDVNYWRSDYDQSVAQDEHL